MKRRVLHATDEVRTEVIHVGNLLRVPTSEKECQKLEALAQMLMEQDPSSPLLNTIGNLIAEYEESLNLQLDRPQSPAERLYNLMESSGKNQVDMANYFGGQSAVSAVLAGKRKISVGAAQKMSKAFNMSLDYFLGDQ